MSRKRNDPDKDAVYYCEEISFSNTLFDEPLHTVDLLALADELFNHDWWQRYRIPVPVIEPTTKSDRSSCATMGSNSGSVKPTIHIAPSQINAWTLAHEAAHIAQFYFYNLERYPCREDHGREFRACYLSVAEILLGKEAAEYLGDNFRRHISVRPEHEPGKPGWIVTVPEARTGDGWTGIFPLWRLQRLAEESATLHHRIEASMSQEFTRISGAIAL